MLFELSDNTDDDVRLGLVEALLPGLEFVGDDHLNHERNIPQTEYAVKGISATSCSYS